MKKTLIKLVFWLVPVLLFTGCKRDFNDITADGPGQSLLRAAKSSGAVLEVAYELTTQVDYKTDFEALSVEDLAYLNPKVDRQRVEMLLMPEGEVRMVIETLKPEKPIVLPHQTLSSGLPEIKRTEIEGSRMYFYDENGTSLGSEHFQSVRQTGLVEDLKKLKEHFSEEDLARAIATMQGQFFVKNMALYLEEVEAQGAFVQQYEGCVTVRQDLSKMGINRSGYGVMLLDTDHGKILGDIIYDDKDNILQKTFYRYHAGDGIQSLEAIQTEEAFRLPSGREVLTVTLMKFDNPAYKLNIQNLH